ncbi:MAG TPA: hypothetical protein VMV77_03800 [Bacteroidales bacterium]|nr:hypothetical protein [Bacteroidales bacterium]
MSKLHHPKPNQSQLIPTPIIEADNRLIRNHPIFCLRYLHKNYNVESCSQADRASLIRQMANLSQLSWDEIKLSGRHGMGSEKIKRKSIKASIPQEITPDVEDFLALRYSGKKAFIGFRNNYIFHIIYIDSDYSVYKH